ncbi:MAG: hypothetical protein PHV30_00710 [Candidatus Margulisbacteria bacterium]|nr:hypothetical protein [Candidatus Margulisiibacteriota bacterium]
MLLKTIYTVLLFFSLLFCETISNNVTLNVLPSTSPTTDNEPNLSTSNLMELLVLVDTKNLEEISPAIIPTMAIIPVNSDLYPNKQYTIESLNKPSVNEQELKANFEVTPSVSISGNLIPTVDHSIVVLERKIFKVELSTPSIKAREPALQKITDEEDVLEKPVTSSFWRDFRWEQWEEKQKNEDNLHITPYMDGFGEIKLYSLKVNGNRNSALLDSVYVDLMRKIKEVDFQIESRFNLLLRAKINEDTEVNYNIQQEPNMPQKTDINLKIRKNIINFGVIDKAYSLGAFTNISKKIDGISVVGSEGSFNYNFGYGQAKSQADFFSRTGSGVNEYVLRNKPILENSLKVWVNDVLLVENVDYQINYFEGKVVFKTPKMSQDNLTFYYEYTNPIEEFIPIATHVNFIGLSGEYTKQAQDELQPIYKEINETYILSSDVKMIQLKKKPVKFTSEKIWSDGLPLKNNRDYYIHYINGKVFFLNKPLSPTINISYLTPQTQKKTEVFNGKGKLGIYYLQFMPILEYSDEVIVQDMVYKRDVDYKIDYINGRLMFNYPIPQTSKIVINYEQHVLGKYSATNPETDSNYKVQFGYFKEFAKAQKDLNTKLISDTYSSPSLNADNSLTLYLSSWPIVLDSIAVYVNQQLISSVNYNLNAYTGVVTINNTVITGSQNDVNITYYYYKEYGPSQWFFSGTDPDFEHNVIFNNQSAHRILSKMEQPVKYDRYNNQILVEYQKASQAGYLTLIYGKDYIVDYYNAGVNVGQIYIVLFNQYLGKDGMVYGVPANLTSYDQFRITYKYNKSNIPDPGDISHEQFEAVYNQNFSKNLDICLDVAKTSKEYSRSFQTTTNYIAANGQYGFTYSLNYPNIVENSEIVYINGQPNAIKNEHYYINYALGKITFINLNPTPSDNVYIKYSYYTTDSGENIQKVFKEGNAVNLRTKYTNNFSSSQLELVSVDDDFAPFGSTKYAAGSNVINFATAVTPYNNVSVATSYFVNKTKLDTASLNGTKLSQTQEKIMAEIGYKPFNILAVTYHWEKENNLSDIDNTVSPNSRAVDNIGYKNMLGVSVGPQYFLTNFSLNQYDYRNDYMDLSNVTDKKSYSWIVDNTCTAYDNRFQLKTILSKTNETELEPLSGNHKLRENAYQKSSFQLTLKPLPFLDLYHLYNRELTEVYNGFDSNNNPVSNNYSLVTLQNYQHNITLYPQIQTFIVDNPNYQYSIAQSEKASLLVSQTPDTTFSLLHQFTWKFINLTNVLYKTSNANSLESNNNINKNANVTEYNVSSFYLFGNIFPVQIQTISRRFTKSFDSNSIPRNTTLYSSGENYSSDSRYGLSLTPLSNLRYSFDFASATNYSFSTENRTTDTLISFQNYPKENTKQVIQYTLGDLLKSQYTSDYTLEENYKNTVSLSTVNITSVNSVSIYNKTAHINAQNLSNALLFFKYPINLNINQTYDDYIDTDKGLKYRIMQLMNINTNIPVADFSVSPVLNYSRTIQYLKVSADIDLADIQGNYNSYLYNKTIEGQLNCVKQLNAQFSFLLNYGYKKIEENLITPPTEDIKSISVHSLGIGMLMYLLPKLSISYTYTLKANINDITQMAFNNYADAFLAEYRPDPVNNGKYTSSVVVTFRREHSWGIGLNDYAKFENNQVNGNTLSTEITDIDNISSTGVVAANIEIPMAERSNGTIEKFVFTAEGNYVEKKDLTGKTDFNYSIISFIFSGKLIF